MHRPLSSTSCWRLTLLLLVLVPVVEPTHQNGHDIIINGAGTRITTALYQKAAFAYRFVKTSVAVQYTPTGSGRSTCRLMSHEDRCSPTDVQEPLHVDFGASDSLLKNADYEQYPDLQMYPTVAIAAVPVFNLGAQAQLVLSMTALAKIFSGEIQVWDDPRILATNPNFTSWGMPPNRTIEVVVRGDGSTSTAIFKAALAGVDPGFATAVGTGGAPDWRDRQVTKTERASAGILSYVAKTPFAIGYVTLGEAMTGNLPIAWIHKDNGAVVEPSSVAIDFAVLQRGMDFGNNGEPPSRLTVDISGAYGAYAWPICAYTYVVVRKATLREGATCAHARETVAFWHWFYSSEFVAKMAADLGFGMLPPRLRTTIAEQLVQDVRCDGGAAFTDDAQRVAITGAGMTSAKRIINELAQIYSIVDPALVIDYAPGVIFRTPAHIDAALDTDYQFLVEAANPAAPKDGVTLAFAGVGLVAICHVDLIVLARILGGSITTWLHPDLLALNPHGLVHRAFGPLTDANQSIELLQGPVARSAELQSLMQRYAPAYEGAAIRAAPSFADEEQLQSGVVQRPYGFSVTSLSGYLALDPAKFRRRDGAIVNASWESVRECATPGVMNEAANHFDLQRSPARGCYPLSLSMFLNVRRSGCDLQMDGPRTRTVAFLEWLFTPSLVAALHQMNMAPLHDVSPEAAAANQKSLEAITCRARAQASALPVGLIVAMCVALLVVLGVPFAVYAWYSTRQMRRMRRQFSNDNVAERCAEAIARFDLEAVAWLSEVPKPNKIQRAFVQIINLLMQVKPFIPDQLLTALIGDSDGESSDEEEEDVTSADNASSYSPSCGGTSGRPSILSSRSESTSASSYAQHLRVRRFGSKRDFRNKSISADIAKWVTKQCTYMFIKFDFTCKATDQLRLQQAATLVSHLVGVGKEHGATIEHVTPNSVALHWGVSGSRANATLRATRAAMEMAADRSHLLPQLAPVFRLQIGIGVGATNTATLSAASHCFFVTDGVEVTSTVAFVQQNVPASVECQILMSHGAYQEVSYEVVCWPRIWSGDVLLWQPTTIHASENEDEWMYQLQHSQRGTDGDWNPKVLHDLFLKAKRGSMDAKQELDGLREQNWGAMTAQDKAALKILDRSLDSLSVTEV